MGIVTLRQTNAPDITYTNKTAPLTHQELDNNFTYFLRNDTSDSMTGGLTTSLNSSFGGATAGGTFGTGANNTGIGSGVLAAVNTGTNNTAIGQGAGAATTTGSDNTCIGKGANTSGYGATSLTGVVAIGSGAVSSGAGSIAIGQSASAASTSVVIGYLASQYRSSTIGGAENVAVGDQAFRGPLGGSNIASRTVAIGSRAGGSMTTATDNICIGADSGYSLTTSGQNIAIGSYALDLATSGGSPSIAIGHAALSNLTSGQRNTAIGWNSALNVGTTSDNTCVGYQTGVNTLGDKNTVVGADAHYSATSWTLNFNTAIGYGALNNAQASTNTAIGCAAMGLTSAAVAGGGNTGVGYRALYSITTGTTNTVVGREAGRDLTTGTNNTFIGTYAGLNHISGSYNILIGTNSATTATNSTGQCVLGDTNITDLRCNDTTITTLSDRRDKTDIIDSPFGLNFITTVKPRQFKWNSRTGNAKDGLTRLGFIAQELLEATQGQNDILNLVLTENPDQLEAKIGNLMPIVVKALQELNISHELLKTRVAALEAN